MHLFISLFVATVVIFLSYLPGNAESQLAELRILFLFFSFIFGMWLAIAQQEAKLAKASEESSSKQAIRAALVRSFVAQANLAVIKFLEENPRYGDVAGDALNFVAYEAQIETRQDVIDNTEIVHTILSKSLAEVDSKLLTDELDDDENEDRDRCAHKK